MSARQWISALGCLLAATLPVFAGKQCIDAGWDFMLRDFPICYAKVGLGSAGNNNGQYTVAGCTQGVQRVNLPHDWAVALPFAANGSNGNKALGHAYPTNSIGWYRKAFAVPTSLDGKRLYLQFDGVFRDTQFWMNGCYLGRNDSGYIGRRFDVTDTVQYGSTNNLITVRVNATDSEGWWYEGAGIYRHVWLITKAPLHMVPDGVFFRTLKADRESASVAVQTLVQASGSGVLPNPSCRVEWRLLDAKGVCAASLRRDVAWGTDENGTAAGEISVPHPNLWSPDAPNLYTLVTTLFSDDKATDEEQITVGIRTVAFDAEKGMLINGVRVQVKGVCMHQDHAGVGVALPDALQDYRIKRLKEMGCNGYRTSHNPPTPELLDACDRQGVVVMDETRFFVSTEEGLDQFRRLLLRDRNHPCVVAWSIGNEEHNVQNKDTGTRMARTMKALQRKIDPSRVCTYAGNNGTQYAGNNAAVDLRGINYIRIMGEGGPERYHAEHPTQPMWGSEEASTLCSRGQYRCDRERSYMSDTDTPTNALYSWAMTAEHWVKAYSSRPWIAGAFAWTGFDYRGETGPYHWPAVIGHFGMMDLCGFPKNNYYYYRAWWTDNDVLHIYPHWNWQGREQEAPTNLWIDTNCDEVELFVNGKSLGKKTVTPYEHIRFPVVYVPGTVEARGTRQGRILVKKLETAGCAKRFRMEADRQTLTADGADTTVVNLTALDAQGREVPDADGLIRFELVGEGRILGVGNGDPCSHEAEQCPDDRWERKFYMGKCQIVIQTKGCEGDICLKASADNMVSDSLRLKSTKRSRF